MAVGTLPQIDADCARNGPSATVMASHLIPCTATVGRVVYAT